MFSVRQSPEWERQRCLLYPHSSKFKSPSTMLLSWSLPTHGNLHTRLRMSTRPFQNTCQKSRLPCFLADFQSRGMKRFSQRTAQTSSWERLVKLTLDNLRYFIVDECDQVLKEIVMRKDVQAIFIRSPCAKQVMMFSATLNKDLRTVCKRFMSDVNILMTSIHFFKFDFEFESVSRVMELD